MKADYLEFKDKCIQMLTEIDFLNQVQMTKEEISVSICMHLSLNSK